MNCTAVVKTFKYRLYPTVAQAAALERHLAEAARLYNAALQERRDAWRMCGKRVGFYDQSAQLKEIRAAGDLAIPSFKVALNVLQRLDRAFQAFFRRVKAGAQPGYPRFRSARRYDSITYPGATRRHWVADGRLVLYGIGTVKLNLHRPMEGTVATVTVKRAAGRWYVYLACHVAGTPLPATAAATGLDLGLASFVVLSDGETVANPRYFARGRAALRLAHRRVARRPRGSAGRREAVRILQRVTEHVAWQRRDFHHKVARRVVNRFDVIAVEKLNVQGLSRSRLARAVHDAGWGQFLHLVREKAENAARVVVAVDPAGTSQQCSGCGAQVPKRLGDRLHACLACGLTLDRDLNAARNIVGAGMALVGGTWPDGRGERANRSGQTAIHSAGGPDLAIETGTLKHVEHL